MIKKIRKTVTETTCHYCDCGCNVSQEDAAIKRIETEFLQKLAKTGITAEKAKTTIFALWNQVDYDTIDYCESVKLSAVLAAKV
jgi:23S rRNA maturation-related 3'-5' exoribonuclease YhaM